MKKHKKSTVKYFFLPILYLLLFFGICFLFFMERTKKETITITEPLMYSGYDVYEGEQCVGQYYYRFSNAGLQFYLLHPRNQDILSPPVSLRGATIPCTEEVNEVKQALSSIVNFSKEELDHITEPCYFVEEAQLPKKLILLLIIACLFACFSIVSILFALIKKIHSFCRH